MAGLLKGGVLLYTECVATLILWKGEKLMLELLQVRLLRSCRHPSLEPEGSG